MVAGTGQCWAGRRALRPRSCGRGMSQLGHWGGDERREAGESRASAGDPVGRGGAGEREGGRL